MAADRGSALRKKLTSADGPLGLIGPENHRSHRDQSSRLAVVPKSQVRDFSYRLSPEGVRLQRRRRARSRKQTLENQIDRGAESWRTRTSGASSRALAAGPQTFQRTRSRHRLLISETVPRRPRPSRPTPDRIFILRFCKPVPLVWCRGKAHPLTPCFTRSDVVAALEKSGAARAWACKNIRSVAGFERRLKRRHLRRLPSKPAASADFISPASTGLTANPSNSTVVPALAAFLRRTRSARPQYSDIDARWRTTGLLAGVFRAGRKLHGRPRASRVPNMATAGARLAIVSAPTPADQRPQFSSHGPAPRGSPVRS